jgi:hypothetical protein
MWKTNFLILALIPYISFSDTITKYEGNKNSKVKSINLIKSLEKTSFIKTGHPDRQRIWLIYDSTCLQCNILYKDSKSIFNLASFNWVPISLSESVVSASIIGQDLDNGRLEIDKESHYSIASIESIKRVLTNTEIINKYMKLQTPTAVFQHNGFVKIYQGINIHQLKSILKDI